jgi:CubicO group peptidase (beta-lactamase class C family)
MSNHRLAACCAAAAMLGLSSMIAPAAAQSDPLVSPATPQGLRIAYAFKAWAAKYHVPNASLAVMTGTNTVVGTFTKGTHGPTIRAPIASNSKAITAVCIARLVDAHKLTFSSHLSSVLTDYFRSNPPHDSRAKTITIGQLLTHSSGITYDPSQGSQGAAIETLPLTQTNLDKQAKITFSRSLGHTPGTHYYYNNMNFAVLGLVIETLTGEAYSTYCYNHVLKPVGATGAELNPPWRIMSSWGGWKISAEDYDRFLRYFDTSHPLLGTGPSQWPKFSLGGGAYYSIGVLLRKTTGNHYNFWHDGSWSYTSPHASFGSYFTFIGSLGVRYDANYEPTVSDSAVSALDTALYNAAVGPSAPAAIGPFEGAAQGRPELLPH